MQWLTKIRINDLLNNEKGQNILVIFVLLLFFVLNALSVHGRDTTVDEPGHYRYGVNILNGNSTRFSDSKMPVSVWNALPAKVAEYLPTGIAKSILSTFLVARLMTTLFSMLAGFVVFIWARKLYGFIPALFSFGLYVLDPNIIAHSQLITTDAYAMGMILIASYWLWKFAGSRSWQDGVILAAMLGLAQLAKYTAIALYPLFAAALFANDWPQIRIAFQAAGWHSIIQLGIRYLKYALVVILISILIINIGFLFNGTFKPFSGYQFRSDRFQALQQKINVTVPVPHPYLEGLDWVVQRERTGVGYGLIYLFGKLQDQGFPGYYLIITLFKEPLATQLIMIAAFTAYFLSMKKRRMILQNEVFLLLPVLFFTIYFNFFYNAQIGMRHYLVIFPLLFVFSGSLFADWDRFYSWQRLVSISLVVYLAASVLYYYPFYLAYTNELAWDKTQAYKIFADSNLDWGQSHVDVDKYFAAHPGSKYPTTTPESGLFVVSPNRLLGITTESYRYAWLRENFKPIGTVAFSHLIYEVSQAEIDHLCATTDYCK